ncbi:hypothetical protein McanMca71_000358 [Microsporum canis]
MTAPREQVATAEIDSTSARLDSDYEDGPVAQSPTSEISEDEYEAEDGANIPQKESVGNLDRSQKSDQLNTQTYSRGLLKPSSRSSKTLQLRLTFGSGDQDILPIIHTRDIWSGSLDLTFPSRESLQKCNIWNSHGNKDIFGVDREMNTRESTAGWDWYYSDIGARFREKQLILPITEEAANTYLPSHEVPKLTVLMGPSDAQTTYSIGRGESFDFSSAWPSMGPIPVKKERNKSFGSSPNQGASAVPNRVRAREGWILNLGNRIQCVSWAPNCYGSSQYLAIVAPILDNQKAQFDDGSIKGAPAFTPSAPYPSAIQIWRFEASDTVNGLRKLDMDTKPRLHMVICTAFGNINRLYWCPIAVNRDSEDRNINEPVKPALLAGLWSDGSVKVFNVDLCSSDTGTKYAYPTHPHIIAATSMGGQTRLVSLQDPAAEIVDALRLRVGTQCLIYSPFLRCFITNDEGDFVRLLPLRRFFSSFAALKSRSIVTALATASLHHPCILAGNAGGTVISNNPLRKLIHSKEKQWQQNWFSQEWINGKDNNSTTPGGVVKFYDGFKAETVNLSKGSSTQEKATGQAAVMVIYEEQTAVTAVAWNPNAPCAGWACAGMGSGLLRVEDLAHQ